ncbi:hypothetical protein LTR36_000038 [Oleoguttula mirabilis]|uniref:Uncharacterized protein n=1 Tax=Oleoguttula mirabilis TaxID=1507867 RepID=A0AAV9JXU7_9PEZI|nr:hypothetical protein LTR36_000038 [Oleoguttula mirabilis]
MADTSTSRNTDAIVNQQPGGGSGEFHAKVGRDEPMQTSGHKPGVNVGNDAVPEFSAKTLPPGSAPAESTFKPNPTDTAPPTQQSRDDNENDAPQASALDFPGSTSGDVNTGMGKPIQGQTSSELRHDGQSHNKNPGSGLDGLKSGAQGKTVDEHLPENAHLRAADNDDAVIGRGTVGGAPAQERVPESANTVAREN